MRIAPIAIAGLLAAAGCQSTTQDEENTLAAAGFQMKVADTPQKTAMIQNLPQRQLTRVTRGGTVGYVFADAQNCNCAYVGSQEAFGRYQDLQMHKQIAAEELDASMNWDWGPWGPWW